MFLTYLKIYLPQRGQNYTFDARERALRKCSKVWGASYLVRRNYSVKTYLLLKIETPSKRNASTDY